MKVLVVGSLHLDVILRAPNLPKLDETVTGSDVAYAFGGKGGNQAVAASRMGAPVAFAGRAGSDAFGDRLRAVLADTAVDCTQLQRDVGPSGMSAAIIDAHGDYGAVIVSAANLHIDPERVDIPSDTGVVLLQNEVPDAVNLAVAQKAQAAGARVWLNAAPARPLPPSLLAALDLLIVNRVEAAFYGDLNANLPVLVTRGAQGVSFAGRDVPAFQVDVASTHGAGDMFVGALGARVALGDAVMDAIPFAQAAAALHVASAAEVRSALSADAVRAFMAAQSNR